MASGAFYAFRDISSTRELMTENKILKGNIDNLEREILNLREVSLENKRMRELLGFMESKSRKVVPAMVIARDHLGLKDTIIIDKGKKNKVDKDMVVISGNGLVGRTRETGWTIARVLLITDRDSVISGIVQRTRDEGAIVGNGEAGLVMKYLGLGCDVKKGDIVITSGFGEVFEKGILIGEVESVGKDQSGLYMDAIVKPAVDMTRLEDVLVIK